MEGRGGANDDDRYSVGEWVRLRTEGESAPCGAIIGFFRREPLTIVVKLETGIVMKVRPEDLEPLP